MSLKTKVAAAAAVLGIAMLGVPPAAQAHTPLKTHVQRIQDHVDRAVDRTFDEAVYRTLDSAGDTINATGEAFNRALNPR
jgi:hypothetical protein